MENKTMFPKFFDGVKKVVKTVRNKVVHALFFVQSFVKRLVPGFIKNMFGKTAQAVA